MEVICTFRWLAVLADQSTPEPCYESSLSLHTAGKCRYNRVRSRYEPLLPSKRN
jgi:hypothetical protein